MFTEEEVEPVDKDYLARYIMFVRHDDCNSRCTVTGKSGKIFKVFRYPKMRPIILGVSLPLKATDNSGRCKTVLVFGVYT
jgi:hypothetical protein